MWKIDKVNEDYLLHRRIRLARHKKRRFLKRKVKRLQDLKKKIGERRLKVIRLENEWKEYKAVPPSNFSFINNPEEVIKYFNSYSSFLKRWYIGDFDLSDVEYLTFDSVALLMTMIKDPDYMQWSKAQWEPPRKEDLKNVFTSTNFLKYVNSNVKEWEIATWDMFHHVNTKRVDIEIWSKLTDLITQKKKNYQWLYPILIECMMNTTDHAWIWRWNKIYNWWIIYDIDRITNIVKICFIDLWVWIFWSLKDWRMSTIWKILTWIKFHKLEALLKEEVPIPSRTKKWERWTGLPQIYEFSRRKEVTKSIIISNNAYWDLTNWEYRDLWTQFSGTFLYWEIDINKI